MNRRYDYQNYLSDSSIELSSYKELPHNKALVVANLEFDIVYCNDSFSKFFRLYIKDSLHRLNPNSELLFLLKGFIEKKYRNLTSDIVLSVPGFTENVLYQISVERIFINAVQYLLVNIESLDQRKKIERKINTLHSALDHGNVPIIVTDIESKIVYATPSFEEVFSKEIDSIYNLSLADLLREHLDFNEHEQLMFAVEKKMPWKKLTQINRRGSAEFWELSLNPFSVDDKLEPCIILSATNLTEHIYQKNLIESSDKKQKLIIENISDLLLILRYSQSFFLFENANDNFCKIFNLDKSKLHLLQIDKLLPPQLISAFGEAADKFIKDKPQFVEFTYEHTVEQQYLCKLTCTTENDAANKIFIVTMKDVTEEMHYREQLEKGYLKEMQLNKMKSDFLANISHEIRTPFNGIIGYSEILDDCLAAQDYVTIKELMHSMKEVLGRVLNLFTNLVEVSQLEAGEVEIEKVDLNCNQVLKKVYEKRQNDAAAKNLNLKIEFCDEECIVEIDWVKLERIVDVLIDNAIKYTKEGFVYIGSKSSDDKVIIIISDSGIGIAKNQIERLLAPFTQEVEGYTRPYEGVGLGLTVAYKLTKLLGGEFEIISEKNNGTEIKISFPRSNPDKKRELTSYV